MLVSDLPASVKIAMGCELPPMIQSDWASLQIEMFKVAIQQAKRTGEKK